MARAATKSNKDNQPKPIQQQKGKIAVRQESPKGDMFFKIVITILIVGIVAVLIWFLVDSLINREEEPERFHRNQFVLLEDIQRIHDTIANPQDNVLIVNEELRDIFNRANPEINMVYILFYSPNFADEFEAGIISEEAYTRYSAAWEKFEELLELGYVVDDEDSARFGFIHFDSIAVFMLNVFTTGNEGWHYFLNQIKDEADPLIPPWGPSLLIIDFNDASPSFSVSFGIRVPDSIQQVIDIVTGAEYEEEEDEY